MPAKSPEALEHARQYHKDRYEWYKEHGICTRCLTRWCAPGKIYCEQCIRDVRIIADKHDPGRVQRRQYNRDRRARLKAEGLCIECGKRKPPSGHVRCNVCAEKHNEADQVRQIRKKITRKKGGKR